jgi:uncharacterized protein
MADSINFLGNDDLNGLYGPPGDLVLRAIKTHLTDFHVEYLRQATFFILSTGNETGLDASPRGGSPGLVQILDRKTVCFADWPGNNKIESLRNIVQFPQVGMLFLFPGLDIFMRINGMAGVTTDAAVLDRLKEGTRVPKAAVVVTVEEVLFHCGRAINRAGLWSSEAQLDRKSLPSAGVMMKALADIEDIPAEDLDAVYAKGMIEDLY